MIDKIRELRAKTGASIGEIRQALEEASGDLEEAYGRLAERLGAIAESKRGRTLRSGVVDAYVHSDGRIGVLIEVQCETDFVARNPRFREFVHTLTLHIAAMNPADVTGLLNQEFVKDPSRRVSQVLDEAIGTFGENIAVKQFSRFEL